MADIQQYKCSTCKCHRVESAFKVNRKGSRLKTCLGCNERKRKTTPAKVNPLSPRIEIYASPTGACERIVVTLRGSDDERREQHDSTFEMFAGHFEGQLIYNGVPR